MTLTSTTHCPGCLGPLIGIPGDCFCADCGASVAGAGVEPWRTTRPRKVVDPTMMEFIRQMCAGAAEHRAMLIAEGRLCPCGKDAEGWCYECAFPDRPKPPHDNP